MRPFIGIDEKLDIKKLCANSFHNSKIPNANTEKTIFCFNVGKLRISTYYTVAVPAWISSSSSNYCTVIHIATFIIMRFITQSLYSFRPEHNHASVTGTDFDLRAIFRRVIDSPVYREIDINPLNPCH